MRRQIVLAVFALGALACGDPGPAPSVAVVSAMPEMLDPARDDADDLSILAMYYDADGDLGGGLAEVHDCRADGVVTAIDIPPIASDDAVDEMVMIEGKLAIVIPDIGAIDIDDAAPAACADLGVAAPVAGEAVFCVVLTDAAGNLGAGDCTAPIAIAAP